MEKAIHKTWDDITRRLGWGQDKPVTVANYLGFGRPDYLYLSGRVLRDKAISRRERDGLLHNFINNFKRFNSREIPDAKLRIEWGGETIDLTTDAEGYFKLEKNFSPEIWTSAGRELTEDEDHQELKNSEVSDEGIHPVSDSSGLPGLNTPWREAKIEVLSVPGQPEVSYQTYADVLLPDLKQAEFGIISDIDDTIMQTDVTSLLKLRVMVHTILKNAGSRRAFAEVAQFYQSLLLGADGEGQNPLFYVSNSPWNLYDLLLDFIETNGLPKGPIMLRDFGLSYEEKPEEYRGHKAEMVHRILRTYPDLPFVLIGDSGEHDLDLYLEAASEFPQQVKQIYIRDVKHRRRAERIAALIESNTDVEVEMLASYQEGIDHARGRGLI